MLLAAFMSDAAYYSLVALVLLGVAALVVLRIHLGRAQRRREAEAHRAALAVAELAEEEAKKRSAALIERFGVEDAKRIVRREIWQGQTEVMLIESLGAPADMDETVMKTKSKRVYKYQPRGANRFGLRVTVEDGVVVGWEDKR